MSGNFVAPTGSQPPGTPTLNAPPAYPPPMHGWEPSVPPPRETTPQGGVQWTRYVAAVWRYKWLVLAITIVGSAAGVFATRFVKSIYQVEATILVAKPPREGESRVGVIAAPPSMDNRGWVELIRSFAILDTVVVKRALYRRPDKRADAPLFEHFQLAEHVRPGAYQLVIDETGRTYQLKTRDGLIVETGAVGDSVGRRAGFLWQPQAAMLGSDRTIGFTVTTPRKASIDLSDRLTAQLGERSSFLRLTLTGEDPKEITNTLNFWMTEFERRAAELKKRNIVELRRALEGQLAVAERELANAESSLESFRVRIITEPGEPGAPIGAGVQQTQDPVFRKFFNDKLAADSVRREREQLERLVADSRNGRLDETALQAIPGVLNANPQLRTTLDELGRKRAELRTERLTRTDEHPRVRELLKAVQTLEEQTVPELTGATLTQLRRSEQMLNSTIGDASQRLRAIPVRTAEEMRLRRQMDVAQNLYVEVKNRYEVVKLQEASAVPDVSIMDLAVEPQFPNSNKKPMIAAMGFAGSLGLALVLALLLDRVDRRFRYPEQATEDMRLDIVGFVPRIAKRRGGTPDPDNASQVVEAFRSLRLNLRHQYDPRSPVLFTVSSPGPGDGKSLVSSNLAMSFAEGGYRTLLIDGDVRRGSLHSMFDLQQRPGLLDHLAGTAAKEEVIKPTSYRNLWVIPTGAKHRRGPEILTSASAVSLLGELSTSFDVIICDSAPLGAGIDAFALGGATGNLLMVLRTGETDRKMAEAKLKVLDRLPVRLLGAVLNDVKAGGVYTYYSYLYGYGVDEDSQKASAPRLKGEVSPPPAAMVGSNGKH